MSRWLERGAIVIVALALAVGIIALLSGGLAGGRDDPGVAIKAGAGPGTAYRDLGARHLSAGQGQHPAYDSDPPTSGPHVPSPVPANNATLTDDQLLSALEVGDVVFMYSTPKPPGGLQAVADNVAPRFSALLAAHGQTVILALRPGLPTITALAWTHILRSNNAGQLRAFAQYWLSRGAGTQVQRIVGND
jgi:Protein of unknown function (DUF3105)